MTEVGEKLNPTAVARLGTLTTRLRRVDNSNFVTRFLRRFHPSPEDLRFRFIVRLHAGISQDLSHLDLETVIAQAKSCLDRTNHYDIIIPSFKGAIICDPSHLPLKVDAGVYNMRLIAPAKNSVD